MIQLKEEEYKSLETLCSAYDEEHVLLKWFLEGNPNCAAWADDVNQPQEAVVVIADFCYFLGEFKERIESKDVEELNHIIRNKCWYKIIMPTSREWEIYIRTNFGVHISERKRYTMKNDGKKFDRNNLERIIKSLNPEYSIIPIREEEYTKVITMDWAADGCNNYKTYEDFIVNGIGYVAIKDDEIISIASSYNTYKESIEVTIGTLDEYRRKGIAAACGATLILECLKRDINPVWEAANLMSVGVANKLGYENKGEYDIMILI